MGKEMQKNCLALGVAACLAFGACAVDMPQIISHRGESQDRPENTMASFRLAFARAKWTAWSATCTPRPTACP